MIVLDTSGLLAALDGDDPRHAESAAVLRMAADARLLSPLVLAELDYLIDKRLGQAAQRAVLADRYEILDILTLDERHFRALPGAGGRPFRLSPADRQV